ncbi:Venom carboxylesterase-6 [Folsomia candida]|uniref:Venom carboxylesterase-6 n=1 Tax=Folsomia candida TaxID=158441 RepID=A0A226DUL6_FOLCA|nr:Venom carboxylesterase-6 [Folsomia candida]
MIDSKKGFVAILCLIKCILGDESVPYPEVEIESGRLVGVYGENRKGERYAEFLGVPYGHVEKRFDISTPPKAWTGVKNATDSGPGCYRYGLVIPGVTGTEDCLTLNIYTPKIKKLNGTNDLLPVMVWLTGGGFIDGSGGFYGGKYFMEQSIVLVTINYRLGAFGFLNAGVKSARGNQALKDIVLSLKWIQKNIEAFSGDKNRVTIFGESAGGAAVSLLTGSPMAKGLFHGAILQSGTATCPYVMRAGDGIKDAKKLAAAVDCPSSNAEYLVECLRRIKPETLAVMSVFVNEFGMDSSAIHMGPTIETYPGDADNSFLSEHPWTLLEKGDFNKVPIIIGFVAKETYGLAKAMVATSAKLKKLNSQFGRIAPSALLYHDTAEDPSIVTERIRQYYFNGSELTPSSGDDLERLISDRSIIHCTRKVAAAYANFTTVYAFNYTKTEPLSAGTLGLAATKSEDENLSPKLTGDRPPGHGDELQYLFEPRPPLDTFFQKITKDSKVFEFSKNFISLWTSFARDGKPGKLWDVKETEWTPLKPNMRQEYLQINEDPEMLDVDQVFENSWKFWDSLPLKEHGKKWAVE